jgi:hypothetical protein
VIEDAVRAVLDQWARWGTVTDAGRPDAEPERALYLVLRRRTGNAVAGYVRLDTLAGDAAALAEADTLARLAYLGAEVPLTGGRTLVSVDPAGQYVAEGGSA